MPLPSGKSDGPDTGLGKVLLVQLVATLMLVAAIGLSSAFGGGEVVLGGLVDTGRLTDNVLASLYGSSLSLAGTLLASRSVKRAAKVAGESGSLAMVPIYSGLLNKLVIVGGGIGFGLVFLGLDPIFLVTGFIVVQLATLRLLARPGPVAAQADSSRTEKIDAQNVT